MSQIKAGENILLLVVVFQQQAKIVFQRRIFSQCFLDQSNTSYKHM